MSSWRFGVEGESGACQAAVAHAGLAVDDAQALAYDVVEVGEGDVRQPV
jgi:hypothetical protein